MNKNSLYRAFGKMIFFLVLMILLPVVMSFTAEYPEPVTQKYLDKDNVYWEIEQVTISPIFDEPETSQVELYFQKPNNLYLVSENREILTRGDTIWTYLIPHKQIQKTIGGVVFNPFNFVDTAQTSYKILESTANEIALKSIDGSAEPDSLQIVFYDGGSIKTVSYLDINKNEVKLNFMNESFVKYLPEDNFLSNTPEGVEIIDFGDE